MAQKKTVLIRVDNTPAEDMAYFIGAIRVPADTDLESLEHLVDSTRENMLTARRAVDQDYQEYDLLEYLEHLGFEIVECPEEIVVGR